MTSIMQIRLRRTDGTATVVRAMLIAWLVAGASVVVATDDTARPHDGDKSAPDKSAPQWLWLDPAGAAAVRPDAERSVHWYGPILVGDLLAKAGDKEPDKYNWYRNNNSKSQQLQIRQALNEFRLWLVHPVAPNEQPADASDRARWRFDGDPVGVFVQRRWGGAGDLEAVVKQHNPDHRSADGSAYIREGFVLLSWSIPPDLSLAAVADPRVEAMRVNLPFFLRSEAKSPDDVSDALTFAAEDIAAAVRASAPFRLSAESVRVQLEGESRELRSLSTDDDKIHTRERIVLPLEPPDEVRKKFLADLAYVPFDESCSAYLLPMHAGPDGEPFHLNVEGVTELYARINGQPLENDHTVEVNELANKQDGDIARFEAVMMIRVHDITRRLHVSLTTDDSSRKPVDEAQAVPFRGVAVWRFVESDSR